MTTPHSPTSSPIDIKTFWATLGQRATGMTIVTADSDEGPTGFLGLSASHVTADPATMLVSVDRKTSALSGIMSRRHFAVNFLPAEATKVADAFGGKAGVTGAARFAEDAWTTLATGAPVYKQALGVFDCAVADIIERGNISIIIGTVVGAAARGDGNPLIYFRGKVYTSLGGAS
jgi:flavin reductase (DIM6/NTAB) family NADH-FMN oxidoreductase RutF